MDNYKEKWFRATGDLDWGVQKAFIDVLTLAEKGEISLVHGADYRDKGACLVNQAGPMLLTGGGHGVPSQHYGEVVSLFDRINREFVEKGINEGNGLVSPMAADILLTWFAPLKSQPGTKQREHFHAPADAVYVEPTDDEIVQDLLNMFNAPAPVEFTQVVEATDHEHSE